MGKVAERGAGAETRNKSEVAKDEHVHGPSTVPCE